MVDQKCILTAGCSDVLCTSTRRMILFNFAREELVYVAVSFGTYCVADL